MQGAMSSILSRYDNVDLAWWKTKEIYLIKAKSHIDYYNLR